MAVKDRSLTLQIWDISGNPKMFSIGRSIYKDADCLILVYDITSKSSFLALETYWENYLAYAQPFEPDEFPVLLVGDDDNDDDAYLRLQYGKGFHNLVYMSYVKHINPAKSHK
jgi:GTPase SAR1 family protein